MMKNGDYGYNLAFCEEKLIPVIKKIADKHVDTPFEIEKKGHGNFVTSVDKAIEQELIEQLHDLIPKDGKVILRMSWTREFRNREWHKKTSQCRGFPG